MSKARIYQPKEAYVLTDYPEAVAYADTQNSVFWTHHEISVDKDIQDMRVNMSEAAAHGILTTLKLFVKYEVHVGVDHWIKRVLLRFPRPEIQRMANCFSFVETNIHAPFYNLINEALLLDNEAFYLSYLDDPLLKERADFIGSLVSSSDDLLSMGAFSMIEGAVLYSSFAFLKHFQAEGKNQMLNVVRGINFSVRDENIHAEAGAWLFRTLKQELLDCGELTPEGVTALNGKMRELASTVYEHESRIIDMIFEKGDIDGIRKQDLKVFVQSRINLCLQNLGISPIFVIDENPIAEWFYKAINSVSMHDFFSGMGNSYNRNWNESAFTWKVKK